MKLKAYLYPITNRLKTGIYNPYLDHFMRSTEEYILFLNKQSPSDTGIFNLLKYFGRIDLVFLNWIENLPEKKGGWMQAVFFLVFLRIKRWLGIRVVWTLHNKISHSAQHRQWKEVLFNNLLKYSDLIITHSREGIRFACQRHPGAERRLFYFPHPVTPAEVQLQNEKKYDILIWGTMAPYKGIDAFLEFLEQQNKLSSYRILIAGKAVSPQFFEKIDKYSSPNIIIKNQFVDSGELSRMIARSAIVLFTYSGASVLSSGALMDSIANRACVVGPHVGAFAEMAEEGIIHSYHNFNELQDILETSKSNDSDLMMEKLEKFIGEHSWPAFSKALHEIIKLIPGDLSKDQNVKDSSNSPAPHLVQNEG